MVWYGTLGEMPEARRRFFNMYIPYHRSMYVATANIIFTLAYGLILFIRSLMSANINN
jgi:hypothetical protein